MCRKSGKAALSHGARQIALTALRLWRREKRFADSIISELLAKGALAASDRAFALELFYGVLRNLTLLDFWIGCLRPSRVESDLRDILRLGLYQLFFLKTAEHAAVNETVELTPKRQRTIINAMLRTAIRQRNDLLARVEAQPLFVRTSHPQFLVEGWQRYFSVEHAQKLCEWNNLPARVYARINLLRINRTEFLRTYPESRPLPDNPNFVEIDSLPSVALERGHCYIQDPSTTIACDLLNPKPAERILDACAAPGMIIRNSLILIVQIEDNRAQGVNPWEAVVAAAQHRLRPILLTASAAILGMIPIMRDVFWGPMAFAVVGGLAGATLLTLLFLPALYVAWFRVREPRAEAPARAGDEPSHLEPDVPVAASAG